MNERAFFVSRLVVIVGPLLILAFAACTLLLGVVTYVLGTEYDVAKTALTVLWSVFVGFSGICFWAGVQAIRLVRDRATPVIVLKADRAVYRTAKGERVSLPYSEVRGVEVEALSPRLGGGHLLIRKVNATIDKVYVFNLDASSTEIFLAFKEKLPQLLQPHSTVRRLVPAPG